MIKYIYLIICCISLSACQFHLRGEMPLAPPLHHLYLQTSDPYGSLARYLKDYLVMSKVTLTPSPASAKTTLVILKDANSQSLLSVSGTQQTRQYLLSVTVEFEITNNKGVVIVGPQSLSESRTITIQSSQILGSSNESTMYYQQMRRALAGAIMNRLASQEITQLIVNAKP